jgi:SAM-dependent methyltransferase
MSADPATCRLCGAPSIESLGLIPDSDYFAGRVLEGPLPRACLWRCRACGSMFRHPILSAPAYLDLYSQGAAHQWSVRTHRCDLEIIRGVVAQGNPSDRVLDVGCGAGDFLLTLPANLEKCGVEPSAAAGASATHRGVRIVGRTIDDLPSNEYFDLITMIDVIEHVPDPTKLLDAAYAHLVRGGRMIVATGDPSITLWHNIFRSRFWYSSFPEHITFPSLQFFRIWQAGKDAHPPTAVRTRYQDSPAWQAVYHLGAQIIYAVTPSLLNVVGRAAQWLRATAPPRRLFFTPGIPGVFTDHQIVTIRRMP